MTPADIAPVRGSMMLFNLAPTPCHSKFELFREIVRKIDPHLPTLI